MRSSTFLLRWARQGARPGLWRPWWLLGLVEVVTYPRARYLSQWATWDQRNGLRLWKSRAIAVHMAGVQ